jgi:ATP-dependent DNA helicase, recQ family
MTRAKNSLYIHHSGTLFGSIKTESLNRIEDRKHYDKPSEIVLNLTLADVNLGFVSGKKEELCQLRSGQILSFRNKLFTTKLNGQICACAYLSKAFQEKLLKYRQMGYSPIRAVINFIVAWNNKETGETEAIVLPNLYLSQKENRPLRKRPAKLNR